MSNPYGWPVDPIEPLTYITDRLNNRKPFIYLRFNDGEAYSMFGMKEAPETNGEHVYSEQIQKKVGNAFYASVKESGYHRDTDPDDCLVGSWWYEDVEHPASKALKRYADYCYPNTRWSRGHIWHREELEKEGRCLTDELLRFVDAVRNFPRHKWLVGPSFLRPISRALKMGFFQIPETDAESYPNGEWGLPGDLTIWCAGFPAKPWAWKSWIESDRTSYHIDAGSLFDGLCGRESREWLKRNGSAHSKFYYGEFARYLGIPV